jgi:glycosyltransferase involved in cell wall biosynthesis
LPYVVIEAAAAQRPLVATAVGGVPEILGPFSDRLVPADSPQRLAAALAAVLLKRQDERAEEARALAAHVAGRFAIDRMASAVETAYRKAIRR